MNHIKINYLLIRDDKILVIKLKNGDKKAFKKLFQKYSDRIYYFTISYIRNKEESEEITQEVFVKLWNKRFELKPELSFSSFLFMIAKNSVIDLLRKKKKETFLGEEFITDIKDSNKNYDSPEYQELKKIIDVSIQELPEKRKNIYLMSRDHGMTYKQIADELNISVKTVESHMRLALQQLKQVVRNKYELILIGVMFYMFI